MVAHCSKEGMTRVRELATLVIGICYSATGARSPSYVGAADAAGELERLMVGELVVVAGARLPAGPEDGHIGGRRFHDAPAVHSHGAHDAGGTPCAGAPPQPLPTGLAAARAMRSMCVYAGAESRVCLCADLVPAILKLSGRH